MTKQKLELTWIGKEERPRLEPRILIEDPALSHHAATKRDGDIFDNMLIQGDNLLALKALEADYAAKVQCIYIDPPFNTGEAFANYDDGLEHSIWLTLMRDRLVILKSLLAPTGTIFIHIDDNELGYLIAIADEIFGRQNRVSVVSFKQSSVSGPKSRNPGVVSVANFILIYAADKARWKNNNVFREIRRDARYNQFIPNFDDPHDAWNFIPLTEAISRSVGKPFQQWERDVGKNFEREMERFVLNHRRQVAQLVSVTPSDVNEDARQKLYASMNSGVVERSERTGADDYYFYRGKQVAFYATKVRNVGGSEVTSERISNIWDDLLSNNIHKEGAVRFPKGKKPEALLQRCLQLATDPGDLVLDSFLGSGTTAAVAHKMHRRWIGVEVGSQAAEICHPRLRRVVDGEDSDGVTKAEAWTGGGGYRFFNLAPSLLEQDRYGNWVIAKTYNPAMLAEALCKHMGYSYAPSQNEEEYWRHGQSTETDFIYVTTQQLTHEACRKISEDVGPDRTLLICCKAFNTKADAFDNLTLVKIPTAILKKCEWGRDDYSLAINNLPPAVDETEEPAAPGGSRATGSTADLFDGDEP